MLSDHILKRKCESYPINFKKKQKKTAKQQQKANKQMTPTMKSRTDVTTSTHPTILMSAYMYIINQQVTYGLINPNILQFNIFLRTKRNEQNHFL